MIVLMLFMASLVETILFLKKGCALELRDGIMWMLTFVKLLYYKEHLLCWDNFLRGTMV